MHIREMTSLGVLRLEEALEARIELVMAWTDVRGEKCDQPLEIQSHKQNR